MIKKYIPFFAGKMTSLEGEDLKLLSCSAERTSIFGKLIRDGIGFCGPLER